MQEIERLRKRIERERSARKEAEQLLEERALQLYYANEQLKALNQDLEGEVRKKTAELEQQKERYQMLVDTAQDIIFVLSMEGYFKYVNPIGQHIVGYTEEDLKGIHFTELIRPDHIERVEEFYLRQVAEQTSKSYLEFPMVCSDGREVWIGQNVSLQVLNGDVLEITAIARDISDRISKEQEISELNLRLSTILSNLQEGILLENEKRQIVLVNEEFCRLFNIPAPPEVLVGTDCSQSAEQVKHLFADPEQFVDQVQQVLANREMVNNTYLELADGRIFERDFIPIYDQDHYIGHLWRYNDVTEQRRMETKIRRSEEKYRGIIENMDLGLMEVDREGIILKPYPKFCDMVGYEEEELIGKKANDILIPTHYLATMVRQDEQRKKGETGVYEIQLLTKSGKLIWVMIGGAPFYDEHGEVIGSVGIHYDITHQKELQEELESARLEAERARDAEKDFLANMSHEIRNPINSVVGMTNLLFDTPLNEEQKEYLNNIKYSSDILLSLISDILDLSKITEGKMEPDLQPLDISELVQAIAQTTRFRLRSSPVTFQLHYDQSIPKYVISDITFLNQILMNLIGNAVKFTHEGQITLTTEKVEEDTSTVRVIFSVEDTGVGIAADQLENIFERFNQAGKATAGKYGGTGLGLPITKKLVELLDGCIKVQSQPGKGTCFCFQLSFPKADSTGLKKETVPEVQAGHIERTLRILIVEDNSVNRLYLERTLKKWGYQFDSSENGKEALLQLQRERYDLILMDIRMPEMDGYETTIRLRSNKTNPNSNIPIIALTASALKDEKDKALAAGMDHHLTKPFTREQLEQAIIRFFNLQRETTDTGFQWPDALQSPELQELYGDDLEYALMIFEVFLEETPGQLQAMATAIAEADWATTGGIAHQIKPHFKMVGRPEVSIEVEQIEMLSRKSHTDGQQIKQLFEVLRKKEESIMASVRETIQQINSYLNQTNLQNEVSDRR